MSSRQVKRNNRLFRRIVKKDDIWCIECCCRSMSSGVVIDKEEYRVCLNKECSMYGKRTNNWTIE